ncbi:MAG: energy transducer TonB [Bacteroidales bacterium]|nr:energy transducer TonB [Bacteroidales bacterium]
MNVSNFSQKVLFKTWIISLLIFYHFTGFGQEILPPEPYGGNRLLKEFIREEMIYPDIALQHKTEGTVVLSFIVTSIGEVRNTEVVQRVSDALDREAIRIFKKILWYPATEIGIPIDYKYSFEIKFDIDKYLKLVKKRGYEHYAFPYEPVDTSEVVYKMLDVDQTPRPVYDSKNFNFSSFIANNLEYPEAAFKQNISGVVQLHFVVEPSGRISNIVVEKALGGGCTEEAIRVIKLVKWNPGILDGMAVRTFMCTDITFNIAKHTVEGVIPNPGQIH